MITCGKVRIKDREYTVVWDSIHVTPQGVRCLHDEELPDDMIKLLTLRKMQKEDPELPVEVVDNTTLYGVHLEENQISYLPDDEIKRRSDEFWAQDDKSCTVCGCGKQCDPKERCPLAMKPGWATRQRVHGPKQPTN